MSARAGTAVLLAASVGAALGFYLLQGLGLAARDSVAHWLTKPLLMPALLAWLAVRLRGRELVEVRKTGVYAALVLSTVGDAALIHKSAPTFFVGVAAFALAHVCYVASIVRLRHLEVAVRSWEMLGLLGAVAYELVVAAFVRELVKPDALLVVALYSLSVLGTLAAALARFAALGDRASGSIVLGAALFFQSDGLIALNQVGRGLPLGGLAVMATYVAGQFLIARGVALSPTRAGSGATG